MTTPQLLVLAAAIILAPHLRSLHAIGYAAALMLAALVVKVLA